MNPMIAALSQGRPLIGLWQALANAYTAEICASAGYDWLLFDGEHAPNTLQTLLAQLQAVSAAPVEAAARPPVGEPTVIKQYLDLGFRTLLIPMMESAEQAAGMVAATRYPPTGIRGVAGSTSRASRFGADTKYLSTAHEHLGLILQIESRAGLDAIEEIAAVEGVDALFIGPGDLAGALGHLGNPRHPDVQTAIDAAIERTLAVGCPVGIFALDAEDARRRFAQGVTFASVGTDIGLLAGGARALRRAMD